MRDYCRQVGEEKRRAYQDWNYWAQPVPNFGDDGARLLIVGLAPAAHGANRTGRMFTGDRSGLWLYRALHRAGFANQPHSESRDDGLQLIDARITAVCHCAPPDNRPAREELEACRVWLRKTIEETPARIYLALGRIAWDGLWRELHELQRTTRKRPPFAHGCVAEIGAGSWALASYHPSQQNTFTGRLTEPMLDAVFTEARRLLASDS